MLIEIGLALERDVEVGPRKIAVFQQLQHPFQDIPRVERNPKHLGLLPGVDQLMVDVDPAHLVALLHHDEAEQIDGGIVAKRDIFAMKNP